MNIDETIDAMLEIRGKTGGIPVMVKININGTNYYKAVTFVYTEENDKILVLQ